jgi:hypothetical protein
MNVKAAKVESESGQIFFVEVSDETVEPVESGGGGAIANASKATATVNKLKEVGTAIAEVCRAIKDEVQPALGESKPSELTLQFGVKLVGEMGIPFVTKGSSEGSFQVTAKWDLT